MNFRRKKKKQAELRPLPHTNLNRLLKIVFLQTNSLVYLVPILIHPFLLTLMVVVVMILLTLLDLIEVAAMTTAVDHLLMSIQDILPHHQWVPTEVTHGHHSEGDAGPIPPTDKAEAAISMSLKWVEGEAA